MVSRQGGNTQALGSLTQETPAAAQAWRRKNSFLNAWLSSALEIGSSGGGSGFGRSRAFAWRGFDLLGRFRDFDFCFAGSRCFVFGQRFLCSILGLMGFPGRLLCLCCLC